MKRSNGWMCGAPRCKQVAILSHLGKLLCERHWDKLCKSEEQERERRIGEVSDGRTA